MKTTLVLMMILAVAGETLGAQNEEPGQVFNPNALPSSSRSELIATNLDQEIRELKPRDVLRFTIEQDPIGRTGILNPVTITELGDAQFQVSAGSQTYVQVKAAGKRLADVRRELKKLLDMEYYFDSTVSIDLLATAPKDPSNAASSVARVTVYGAVNATLALAEDRKKMLSEAIAGLGARNQSANLKKVEIFRKDPTTKKTVKLTRNVKVMLDDGDVSEDLELLDGDMIHVLEKVFNSL